MLIRDPNKRLSLEEIYHIIIKNIIIMISLLYFSNFKIYFQQIIMPQLISNLFSVWSSLIESMLIRDPNKRLSLEEIALNPWLAGAEGHTEQLAEMLPLVSREHLSEEDHSLILHRMVSGNIGNMDQVLEWVYMIQKKNSQILFYFFSNFFFYSHLNEEDHSITLHRVVSGNLGNMEQMLEWVI